MSRESAYENTHQDDGMKAWTVYVELAMMPEGREYTVLARNEDEAEVAAEDLIVTEFYDNLYIGEAVPA